MRKNLFFSLSALLVLFSSCVMYHPQTADIPLIEKKGDLRVEASAWASALLTPDAVGGSATVSYGVTDWMAGQLHGSIQDVKNYNLQAAVGSYTPFENKVLEAYIGINYGKSYRDIGSTRKKFDREEAFGSAYTYFAQVNFGWNHLANSHIDVGFGLKLGAFAPNYSYVGFGPETPEKGELISDMTQTQTLVEPRVFLRAGAQNVKVQLGVGYCVFSGSGFSDNPYLQYDPISVSLGLSYSF